MTDLELLSLYARENDQQAFTQLVQRHVHWVNSMALRLVYGNSAQAADVTQAVFILLARKASSFRAGTLLSGWLFIVTRYAAAKSIREESRRRKHERKAAAMRQDQHSAEQVQWDSMAATLDELVHRLRTADRDAVLLRFYEKKSFSEVGASLNISEEAARKRVSRAVEQLRTGFARRGIAVGAVALAATMSANLTQPASAAVIAGAAAAPAAAGTATPFVKGLSAIITWASLKPAAVLVGSILLLAGGTAAVLQLSPAQNQAAAAAPATMPSTAPSNIRYGRVVDENDKPVAGARITHFDRTDYLAMARLAGSTTSDADGRFQIPVVGEYEAVVAQANGFGMGGATVGKPTDADAPIELRMKPAVSLRVKFVDPVGRPAAGLRVRVSGAGEKSTGMRWTAAFSKEFGDSLARTADDQGVCVFPDLPQSGTVWLDPLDEQYASIGWPNAFDLLDAATTDAGTFKLKLAGSISGRIILDDTKLPAAGVKMLGRITEGKGDVVYATTDANGRFVLKQLAPGSYNLLPHLSDEMSEHYAANGKGSIPVAAGAAVEQDFALVIGGIIRGRIVEQETGKPLAKMGAFVDSSRQPFVGYGLTARSREDGTYLVHVVPGSVRVQFELPMPPGLLQPKPLSREITVAENQTVEFNFEVPQHPGPKIRGRTVDPQGKPLAGVVILAQGTNDYPSGPYVATSGPDGSFTLPGLDRDTLLRARKGQWTTVQPIPISNNDDLSITLRNDAHSSLRAHIVGPDGQPVAGAKVELTSTMGPGARQRSYRGHIYFDAKTTTADGTCVFKQVSPDINYGFVVHAKGFGIADVEFPIQAGQAVDAPTIKLVKADSFVSGMVIDENGLPVSGIRINVNSEKSEPERVQTDIAGQFRVGDIIPGDRVSISAADEADTRRGSLEGVAAGSDGLVITLQARPQRP